MNTTPRRRRYLELFEIIYQIKKPLLRVAFLFDKCKWARRFSSLAFADPVWSYKKEKID
jgi:hypothetical protein